jgi:hypothetical protein
MAEMISGIVMNGPIPTICAMFSEVAGNRPMARMNPRDSSAGACESPRVAIVTLRVEARPLHCPGRSGMNMGI